MRLHLHFRLESPLVLPLNYQQVIQGFIYHQIQDRTYAQFLHNKGYTYENRQFRLFTFSRLLGQATVQLHTKTITFKNEVHLQISSCLPKFVQELGQSFLLQSSVQLNGHPLIIEEMRYQTQTVTESPCTIEMLSPITVHRTDKASDGRKVTKYFSPRDPAFEPLINENLSNKYAAYYGKQMPSTIHIKPLQLGKRDKVITRFKGFIIEGWNGTYQLQGDPEILTFASAVGLGARNSQGFGLPEVRN
ncbi:CRISPR-associated endoribonuclease Cas6 [Hazenella sp. IB182353]|uniref:CRISPR-associated endoribonuclease Cas6 n=1 Tax=Polycladospora coralii TaxID=2771432 RepID=UPI0017475455|nr:CRISPR-associated endoribonuclease Cas6 [Polycladospora coralii]MBS7530794.1 CRISPR-associated endoribonuclease Cas6 [Polycladospora coralii]